MASQGVQVYQCDDCGATIEVLRGGSGVLVCCDRPMRLLAENTTDAAREKHVPVVERIEGGIRVRVGSVAHPMKNDHWIEWIELLADGKVYRQHLAPGDEPEAIFPIDAEEVTAREMCNLHGLWKA